MNVYFLVPVGVYTCTCVCVYSVCMCVSMSLWVFGGVCLYMLHVLSLHTE